MTALFANNASTTLSSGISPSDTTLTVAAGTGAKFPSPTGSDYFVLTLQDSANSALTEVLHVTARATDTMTIVRAQEGTSAQSWTSGDFAFMAPTAGTLDLFAQTPVGNADLAQMAAGTVKSNLTGGLTAPADNTLAAVLSALISDVTLASPGHVVIGPIQMCWGQSSAASNQDTVSVIFEKAFPSTPWVVIPGAKYASGSPYTELTAGCDSFSTAGAIFTALRLAGSGSDSIYVQYLAFGPSA